MTHPDHPIHPEAPDINTPISEHVKHAALILEMDQYKQKPKDHPARDEDETEIPVNP